MRQGIIRLAADPLGAGRKCMNFFCREGQRRQKEAWSEYVTNTWLTIDIST
ncbi:hypothetical protein CFter6_2633 [Collimonas fungivorans]|uniref:Uncharacterized protein n=1 Tax=Collimonas fungivorans TaxID=158899 RepID=A0A127PCX3_9BURK|nr:hypothetical protein CFter6_2633 [Collimonas fungivorans]